MWTIFKVFTDFVAMLLLFFTFLFFWSQGMWDLRILAILLLLLLSDSVRPHGLQPTRILRPWDLPGKSTGVGCHCPLP